MRSLLIICALALSACDSSSGYESQARECLTTLRTADDSLGNSTNNLKSTTAILVTTTETLKTTTARLKESYNIADEFRIQVDARDGVIRQLLADNKKLTDAINAHLAKDHGLPASAKIPQYTPGGLIFP